MGQVVLKSCGSAMGAKAPGILLAILVAAAAVLWSGPELAAPPKGTSETWLFFDGVCNLCDGFVNFVFDQDREGRVKFGALQRHTELLQKRGAGRYAEGGEEAMSTLVVIQGDKVFVRSTAALHIAFVLGWPWRALSAAVLLPEGFRDTAYRLVARHRYQVFGRAESCRVPTGEFKKRFLEYTAEEEADSPFANLR